MHSVGLPIAHVDERVNARECTREVVSLAVVGGDPSLSTQERKTMAESENYYCLTTDLVPVCWYLETLHRVQECADHFCKPAANASHSAG